VRLNEDASLEKAHCRMPQRRGGTRKVGKDRPHPQIRTLTHADESTMNPPAPRVRFLFGEGDKLSAGSRPRFVLRGTQAGIYRPA
jgi:hypothetical protein